MEEKLIKNYRENQACPCAELWELLLLAGVKFPYSWHCMCCEQGNQGKKEKRKKKKKYRQINNYNIKIRDNFYRLIEPNWLLVSSSVGLHGRGTARRRCAAPSSRFVCLWCIQRGHELSIKQREATTTTNSFPRVNSKVLLLLLLVFTE